MEFLIKFTFKIRSLRLYAKKLFQVKSITTNSSSIFLLHSYCRNRTELTITDQNFKFFKIIPFNTCIENILILKNKYVLFGDFRANGIACNLSIRDHIYENEHKDINKRIDQLNTYYLWQLDSNTFASKVNDTIYIYDQAGEVIQTKKLVGFPEKLLSGMKITMTSKPVQELVFYWPQYFCYFKKN